MSIDWLLARALQTFEIHLIFFFTSSEIQSVRTYSSVGVCQELRKKRNMNKSYTITTITIIRCTCTCGFLLHSPSIIYYFLCAECNEILEWTQMKREDTKKKPSEMA